MTDLFSSIINYNMYNKTHNSGMSCREKRNLKFTMQFIEELFQISHMKSIIYMNIKS